MGCDCCNNETPEDDRPSCALQDLYGQPYMLAEPNPEAMYARTYQLSYSDVFRAIEDGRSRGIHAVRP